MADEKKTYYWNGLNSKGGRESGSLSAKDMVAAQAELRKLGIEIIKIDTKMTFWQKLFAKPDKKKKIKSHEILLFTRHLSAMLASGLPILQALDIIGADNENPLMRHMIDTVRGNIASGKSLAESLGEFPECFSILYTSLVSAGEQSGTLDKVLVRIGTYIERTEKLRKKVFKALLYPIIIFSVAFGVGLVLLLFVVPQFQTMFNNFGAQLPMFTQIVVDMSDFLRAYWFIFIAFVVGLVFAYKYLIKNSKSFHFARDRFILKILILGPVFRKSIIARFARTLATMLDAGMPIVEALKVIRPGMGNDVYTIAVDNIIEDLTSGHQLSEAMNSTTVFPVMAVQMVSVGEVSGSLSMMLTRVADYYEEEVNDVVDNLSSLIEPLIMVVLGIIIGGFVIAMYLPIFQIGTLF